MTNVILRVLEVVQEMGRLEIIPPFNFGGNKLEGIATGTESTDAVTKGQLDLKVDKAEDNAILIEIQGTGTDGAIQANDFGIAKTPYDCTIKKVTLLSREASATLEVDILKGNTYATLASITGTGTKPAISNAQEASITDFVNYGSVGLTAGQLVQVKAGGTPSTTKRAWILLEIERP